MIHKMMYTRFDAPPGQVEPAASTWVVPAGVYVISAVVVGGGILRASTKLVHSGNGNGPAYPITGDGGGYGGSPGGGVPGQGGRGGNGGYLGNGGNGGAGADGIGTLNGYPGASGSGGGGGGSGGGGNSNPYGPYPYPYGSGGYPPGGVGLNGVGNNGSGGSGGYGGDSYATNGNPGYAGSELPGATIVAAPASDVFGYNLAWANNIAVTPGETLNITGACRILWGGGRSYPSNAGSV